MLFYTSLYLACNYLSILGSKLICLSKSGPSCQGHQSIWSQRLTSRQLMVKPIEFEFELSLTAWRHKLNSCQLMLNSSPPIAAYMWKWTGSALGQVMACCLVGAKPLPEPVLLIINWTPGNKFQWSLNQNFIIFIQENAFEIVVCENGGHFVQGEMS